MKQGIYEILFNFELAPNVFRMVLKGDTSALLSPGQFVNIKLDGFYLRRPISVCDYDDKTLTLVYKTVGEGTEAMSKYPAGTKLDVLVGLGNGYDLSLSGDKPLLVGGGVAYTVGAVFYGLGHKKRYIHSVFHLFCLVGSALHILCILFYVI